MLQVVPYISDMLSALPCKEFQINNNNKFPELVLALNKSQISKVTLGQEKSDIYFPHFFRGQYICLAVCSQFGFSSPLASCWGRLALAHGLSLLPLLSSSSPLFFTPTFLLFHSFSLFTYTLSPHFCLKRPQFLFFNLFLAGYSFYGSHLFASFERGTKIFLGQFFPLPPFT